MVVATVAVLEGWICGVRGGESELVGGVSRGVGV